MIRILWDNPLSLNYGKEIWNDWLLVHQGLDRPIIVMNQIEKDYLLGLQYAHGIKLDVHVAGEFLDEMEANRANFIRIEGLT